VKQKLAAHLAQLLATRIAGVTMALSAVSSLSDHRIARHIELAPFYSAANAQLICSSFSPTPG
jgi:hypothetical protein